MRFLIVLIFFLTSKLGYAEQAYKVSQKVVPVGKKLEAVSKAGAVLPLAYQPQLQGTPQCTIKNMSKITVYQVEARDAYKRYFFIGRLLPGEESVQLPPGSYKIKAKVYNYQTSNYVDYNTNVFVGEYPATPEENLRKDSLSTVPLSIKIISKWDPQTRTLTLRTADGKPADFEFFDRMPILTEIKTDRYGIFPCYRGAAPEVEVIGPNYVGNTTKAVFKLMPTSEMLLGGEGAEQTSIETDNWKKAYFIIRRGRQQVIRYWRLKFTPRRELVTAPSVTDRFPTTETSLENPLYKLQMLYKDKLFRIYYIGPRPEEAIPAPYLPAMPLPSTKQSGEKEPVGFWDDLF